MRERREEKASQRASIRIDIAPLAVPRTLYRRMHWPLLCILACASYALTVTLRRPWAQIESLGTSVSYRVESLLSVRVAPRHSDREPARALLQHTPGALFSPMPCAFL
jgi:hypothetical protein